MSKNTQQKKIRFIDSDYNLLFMIPDGGSIRITFADGLTSIRDCHYMDAHHTQIGNTVYHICEFAEIMEKNGSQYAPVEPASLPDMCYTVLPSNGELVALKRDELGYFPCAYNSDNPHFNQRQMKHLNEGLQVTPQQRAAMEAGSMFGWGVPAANPNNYDMRGKPKPQNPDSAITYAIYQLLDVPDTRDYRFVPLHRLHAKDLSVIPQNYERVYSETIHPSEAQTDQALLGSLYYRFNTDHPADFSGHSLSVSDVVTIQRTGATRAYYVDAIGFSELPSFQPPENALKNAEMAMEDDYGMIDGIINNGKSPAVKADEKASIQGILQGAKPERAQATQHQKTSGEAER